MPTNILAISTSLVKILEADDTRESIALKFQTYTAYTAEYIRVSDSPTETDSGDSWLLMPGEAIFLSKADGDRTDKAYYARTASGSGYICVWEHFRKGGLDAR